MINGFTYNDNNITEAPVDNDDTASEQTQMINAFYERNKYLFPYLE